MAKKDQVRKVLRIGIVQGGKIVEERLLRGKDSVTIGQSSKNKFVIPSARIPITYNLIEAKGGQYSLCFEKGMFGKVLIQNNVMDLKAIAQNRLAERRDDKFYFKLAEDIRGKVTFGDVTILFQFVTPPPEVPRLQLPASAKGAWWRNIDTTFMIILIMSFLIQGGFEGYQEWYWRSTGRFLVKERAAVPKLLQTLVKIEKQDQEQEEPEEGENKENPDEVKDSAADEDKPKEAAEEKSELLESKEGENVDLMADTEATGLELADPGEMDGGGLDDLKADMADRFQDQMESKRGQDSIEDRMARADRQVSDRTVAGILGSEFGAGDGGADVLSSGLGGNRDSSNWGEGDITVGGEFGGPKSDLFAGGDDSIGSLLDSGTGPGGPGMPIGMGLGQQLDIDIKADTGPQTADAISGPKKELKVVKVEQKEEKKITVRVRGGNITGVVGGKIDRKEVEKYVRQRTAAVQRCYYDAVRRNPSAGGRLVLKITIGTNGRADVSVVSDSVGDASVSRCVVGKIKTWRFPKPEDKAVTMQIPFVFRSI